MSNKMFVRFKLRIKAKDNLLNIKNNKIDQNWLKQMKPNILFLHFHNEYIFPLKSNFRIIPIKYSSDKFYFQNLINLQIKISLNLFIYLWTL